MSEQRPVGFICGGPDPATQKACYGGCYEWCITAWCVKAPSDLTKKERRRIRRWQKQCGGYFRDDLRELSDFAVTPSMLAALRYCEQATAGRVDMVTLPKRQAQALLARDLIWSIDDEYHVTGAGVYVVELADGERGDRRVAEQTGMVT